MTARMNPNKKQWALLVYIAGHNDLSLFGTTNLDELSNEGAAAHVYAAVQIHTMDPTIGPARYEIAERDWLGIGHRTLIERLKDEMDTGDPATLSRFLQWGLERFPAENTLAVIWGHGSGFQGARRAIADDAYVVSSEPTSVR